MQRSTLLTVIGAILVAGGLTHRLWLGPLWELLRAESAPLEGLGAIVGMLGALVAAAGLLHAYLLKRGKAAEDDSGTSSSSRADAASATSRVDSETPAVPAEPRTGSVSARHRGVSIGGSAVGNVIVTGDADIDATPADPDSSEPD